MPLPRSLAHLKREITEKKWAEAGSGLEAGPPGRNIRCRRARGPTARLRGVPRGWPQGSTNQRKTGHCLPGQYLHWTKNRPHGPALVVPMSETDEGPPLQGVSWVEGPAEDAVGEGAEETPVHDSGPPCRHTILHGIRRRGLGGTGRAFFCFFLLSPSLVRSLFRCDFFGAYHIFLGQAWA